MLRYCAWCGQFQGMRPGQGHQIRANVCEIDTATICPSCLSRQRQERWEESPEGPPDLV